MTDTGNTQELEVKRKESGWQSGRRLIMYQRIYVRATGRSTEEPHGAQDNEEEGEAGQIGIAESVVNAIGKDVVSLDSDADDVDCSEAETLGDRTTGWVGGWE